MMEGAVCWAGISAPAELLCRPVCPADSWEGRQVFSRWRRFDHLGECGPQWLLGVRREGSGIDLLLMNCLVEQNCIMLVVFKRVWQVLKCAGWCCNLCCGDRMRTETAAADWGTKTVFFIHEQQRWSLKMLAFIFPNSGSNNGPHWLSLSLVSESEKWRGSWNAPLESAIKSRPVIRSPVSESAETALRDSLFPFQADCCCLHAQGAHSPVTAPVRSYPHNQIQFY